MLIAYGRREGADEDESSFSRRRFIYALLNDQGRTKQRQAEVDLSGPAASVPVEPGSLPYAWARWLWMHLLK